MSDTTENRPPTLVCEGEGGVRRINVTTMLGKREWPGDREQTQRFVDEDQCEVKANADNEWEVTPVPGAANQTMLNDEPLTEPAVLKEGDVLAVGNPEKGITKAPITIRLVPREPVEATTEEAPTPVETTVAAEETPPAEDAPSEAEPVPAPVVEEAAPPEEDAPPEAEPADALAPEPSVEDEAEKEEPAPPADS